MYSVSAINKIDDSVRRIQKDLPFTYPLPRVAILVTAELVKPLVDRLTRPTSLSYLAIGHLGATFGETEKRLWAGLLQGTPVIVASHRPSFATNPGHQAAHLHRTLMTLGCTKFILISRAARLNEAHEISDIAVIRDHVLSLLKGDVLDDCTQPDTFAPATFTINAPVYSEKLRSLAWSVADELQLGKKSPVWPMIHPDGVLIQIASSELGTPAEFATYRRCANLIARDIGHEAKALHYGGAEVLALCHITDPNPERSPPRRKGEVLPEKNYNFTREVLLNYVSRIVNQLL